MRRSEPACVPPEALGIMTARTLANSHGCLLPLVGPGMRVLDVGCGPGTLTAEIARRAAPGGVVGMDVNPEMIAAAEVLHPPAAVPNLVFYRGDARASGWEGEFDLINACRVLQWIPDAEGALARMAHAARPGGLVVTLDYDHTQAAWTHPPAAWTRFYGAFLAWRAAAGLDNAIVRRLPAAYARLGLDQVRTVTHVSTVGAEDPDFFRVAGMWRLVVDSRGRQMVEAGALGEAARAEAFEAYTAWMRSRGARLTLHEACVIGRRPPDGAARPRA